MKEYQRVPVKSTADAKTYTIKDFIEKFVLPDLRKMIDHELHYYAFGIICQAIEVLGSIFDQEALDEHGKSENRFDNAITKLFRNTTYRENKHSSIRFCAGP